MSKSEEFERRIKEIKDKMDSGEINNGNFDYYTKIYKELRYASYIANAFRWSIYFIFGYLIGYFLTH